MSGKYFLREDFVEAYKCQNFQDNVTKFSGCEVK